MKKDTISIEAYKSACDQAAFQRIRAEDAERRLDTINEIYENLEDVNLNTVAMLIDALGEVLEIAEYGAAKSDDMSSEEFETIIKKCGEVLTSLDGDNSE